MTAMSPRSRQVSAEISLPFLKIGTNDVGAFFTSRRREPTGPFLLISASSGLALDTAFHSGDGSTPHLWAAHGELHQLWYLEATGHGREVHIISASNNLLLDGRAAGSGDHLRMRGRSDDDAAWQRWRVSVAPGLRTHRIINAGTGFALDCPHEAEARTMPVLWEQHGGGNQQWLLVMPFVVPEGGH
ncbi:RICIN domain-containing protein [Streptomyces sp. NRRL WC-3626]|uniref:RICIN domain-containing protein n=2 Tax=Streptomyces edwardsiae TaxID=3075527 RepID=A0ABU2QBY9_9ACTN|nr:RICIN domain-containing protein [Streptomyces sp. NRRL WC-3626]MDT0401968.1 RICIN domain-containing protein [Streptomyces sp. DSM 41635]